MSVNTPVQLTLDEVDDLLYFTRVNEVDELHQCLSELARKYQCKPGDALRSTIDPESGNTVLHYCAANGFANLFPTLLSNIRDATSSHTTPAQAQEDLFVNRTNSQGNTALHWAALNGHLAIVKQLVEAGADMWLKNSAGHLAMFEAERAEKGDVVQYLLEAGGKEVERTGNEREDDVDADEEAGPAGNDAQG